MRHLMVGVLLMLLAASAGAMEPFEYRDAAEEARFRALAAELRCVMCQNQSLADSNAQIAADLRKQVLNLMREGRSDDEIKTYLVARYTDFVLYKPPVTSGTWLLWFGPGIVLVAGGIAVVRIVRRRAAQARTAIDGIDDTTQEW